MVTITLHCPHCQSNALVRNGHAPNGKQLGSGSLEQDGPLCIVAMEEEEQARLMHQHRL